MDYEMKPRVQDCIIYSPFPVPPLRSGTVFDFTRESTEAPEHKTALIENGRQVSYAEFMESLRRSAAGLQHLGLGRGDRVYVSVRNSIDGFLAMCALACTGAAVVTRCSPEFEADYMRRADVTHILTDVVSSLSRNGESVGIKGWLSLGDIPGCTDIQRFQSMPELNFVAPDGACNDSVVLVGCSSGTTDTPKAIELSTRSLFMQAAAQKLAKLVKSDDVVFPCAPICQFFGFTECLVTIHCGATAVIESLDVPAMIRSIEMHKVTHVMTCVSRLTEIMRGLAAKGSTVASLQGVLCAGATPTPTLTTELLTTFPALVEFRNVYGMTEMCGPITTSHPGVIPAHNTVGFPMPGIRIKIINTETGSVLGPMQLGEVLVHSETLLMLRYTHKPEETAAAFTDEGWLRTGDLGFYNEDGCLFLRDRIKTLIRYGERMVSPCELEELLLSHPDVLDAAVLGVPRHRYGSDTRQELKTEEQSLTALVIAAKRRCPNPHFAVELKRYVAERGKPSVQLDGGIFFVDEIPKTTTGKIARTKLLPKLDSLLLCAKLT